MVDAVCDFQVGIAAAHKGQLFQWLRQPPPWLLSPPSFTLQDCNVVTSQVISKVLLLNPRPSQIQTQIHIENTFILLTKVLQTMGPGERATLAAKDGARCRLDSSAVKPGCIAWMPWAGVIKVTHRDHHKGASDGVEVLGAEEGERPGRRAWNHPVVVLKKRGERVWVVAMTSFKGRSLAKKFGKYSEKTRTRLLREVLPIWPCNDHPFTKTDKEYRGLSLENGRRMHKTGYVKLGEVYAMDWRDMQRFDRKSKRELCLDNASVQRLLRLFKKIKPRISSLMGGGDSRRTLGNVDRTHVDETKTC